MKVARYVVLGLLAGAVSAFVAELLRPRHRRDGVPAERGPVPVG